MGICFSEKKKKTGHESENERPAKELCKISKVYDFVPDSNHVEDIWELFTEGTLVGKGASCRVYSATPKQRDNATPIALKLIARSYRYGPRLFQKEQKMLAKVVGHKCILNFKGSWIDDSYFILGTELFNGGNMHHFIKESYKDGKRLSEHRVAEIVYQLFDAIKFLHERNVVHRDIKLENIALRTHYEQGLNIVIIDFGDSQIVEDNEIYHEFVGTPYYIPPEIMKKHRYGWEMKKSDCWSAGVCIYVIFYGGQPFFAKTKRAVLERILKNNCHFPTQPEFRRSNKGVAMLKSLLTTNTHRRWDPNKVLRCAWLLENLIDLGDVATNGI